MSYGVSELVKRQDVNQGESAPNYGAYMPVNNMNLGTATQPMTDRVDDNGQLQLDFHTEKKEVPIGGF